MSFEKQIQDLRDEAAAVIEAEVKKNHGKLYFTQPMEVCYSSCDSGYFGDWLACIIGETYYMIEEGSVKKGKKLSKKYDIEEDEDSILATDTYVGMISTYSLAEIADRINKGNLSERVDEMSKEVTKTIESLKDNIPVNLELCVDWDCRWYTGTVVKVGPKTFEWKNGSVSSYDNIDGNGSSLDLDELALIADAVA